MHLRETPGVCALVRSVLIFGYIIVVLLISALARANADSVHLNAPLVFALPTEVSSVPLQ